MNILHHQRLAGKTHVSIERLFSELRNHASAGYDVATSVSPRPSQGVVWRLENVNFAKKQTADVHHIVGDVHYLAFSLPPERTVLTIHDCAALDRLSGVKHGILKYFWFTGPMRRAAIVTTISEATKKELRRWVGPLADKVRVVPNCVGSEFVPHEKAFDAANITVLQVGTGWNKNVVRVAEAIKDSNATLEIVGKLSDTQKAEIDSFGISYRELGRISDAELLATYQRSDLVVFASLYEGFGLPILEAQATGRAVITSNCSSMPEVAGDGAVFVNPSDTEEIRLAIQQVIDDGNMRERLISAGFTNVARYQPPAIASMYEAIYREVVST